MDPKSPSHPDTRTTHVSSIQGLHMRLVVFVCPLALTQYGGAIFLGEENP